MLARQMPSMIDVTNPSKAAQLRGGEERERVAADERKKYEWVMGKAVDSEANQHTSSVPKSTVDEITQRRLKLLEDDDE